ncbi:MAG TPA: RtcB family protein [candidate division Zixibacteria bacterium]|nr:RtcB family protein [candidate division Zixibacteria bacterium]MDD4917348.1 RtcB family protein [candidate division Zixibacteria bacterium]MDM7971906.1 RtcB family protein [candidate division Zixibacteria bacterium]HOD66260.1 RtcB family protein [candidate division Zixibacteria bacterium]HOZ06951.1 RtcB family protein [candidate division Zixibacteria bacterium]
MAWQGPLDKIDAWRYQIPSSFASPVIREKGLRMRVPGLIFTDEAMLEAIRRDDSLFQVANVATLPGIVEKSIAMPDIHHGYGFAIGAVAAFDGAAGVISPGGVGYDINCGVRLMRTDLHLGDVLPRIETLVDTMFANVPSGVGSSGRISLSEREVDEVLATGARWAVSREYGLAEDLEAMEEGGCLEESDPSVISKNAKARGHDQLGTLGAGNHFLEIQRVDAIYEPDAARVFGLEEVGQIAVMIHTGSRGCGHQICTDYLESMRRASRKYGIALPDQQLMCAPVDSPEARQYFLAMNAAANFAWCNRQVIMHWVRESFEAVFGQPADRLGLRLVYDIAHNMAKREQHDIGGKKRWVYVHRKGATRAFGPGHRDVPEKYRAVGQPVIIPGDMGTASYLLVGTAQAMRETFGSSCHGAGRRLSRTASIKEHRAEDVIRKLREGGIYLRAKSKRVVAEEAPGAYKSVDEVVAISHHAGITRKVARLTPVGVVKG